MPRFLSVIHNPVLADTPFKCMNEQLVTPTRQAFNSHNETMRLTALAAGAILPLLAFAAKSKGREDSFSQYHNKAKSLSAPITILDDGTYNKFTGLPRNYTSAILLTAMDARFGCQMCRDFQPEWELLAKSWVRGDGEGKSRLLFGTLDFLDGRQTFQSVSLLWIMVNIME